jgi:hypothetical protein
VSFGPVAGTANVSNSGGGIASKVPKSGTLSDLLVILKENGLNYIAGPNIMLRDERIIQYSMKREKLPTEASTVRDFAQWLSKTYTLGVMKQNGQNYEAGNPAEGWRVVVTEDEVQVLSIPRPDNPN